MWTVTLIDGDRTDATRRAIADAGAAVEWEIVSADVAAGSLGRTRVGICSQLPPGLRLGGRVRVFRRDDPYTDAVLIDGDDPVRAARLAFAWAAGHARQRIALAAHAEAARPVARDYPQIRVEESVPTDLTDVDVVLGAPPPPADAPIARAGDATATAHFDGDIALFEGGLLAAAMMLEHIHEGIAADRVARFK
jgi:hypothetical protein